MNKSVSIKQEEQSPSDLLEARIRVLIQQMTLQEKIGQLHQVDAGGETISDTLRADVANGRIGSVINQDSLIVGNELQHIAVKESRLGIPLLAGRDVVHGFRTVMPIPLGQAASWNPDIVREGARIAALEARRNGINWTFAPMIDIARDARWGRIAEGFGEDPYLTGTLGAAMTAGFQGDDLGAPGSIAACAKHFAGYGASESGRDYNTTNIPENELRNIYLPPFKAAIDAGAATLMSSFSDIDGVPATANAFLLKQVLREEWGFDGMVVSDWDSVRELSVHGLTANDREAAFEAASAGVDMEMSGGAFIDHLADLVEGGQIALAEIDHKVANILRVKFRLGLFEAPFTEPDDYPAFGSTEALAVSKLAATDSAVLLQNRASTLPLDIEDLSSLAVIGPLADAPAEQLGTWVFDGDAGLSVTPLQAIRDMTAGQIEVSYAPALTSTRDQSTDLFDDAITAAQGADAVLLFLGEEAILSGEAHSRADINLPGAQVQLVRELRKAGKPIIAVIMSGRPLTLDNILDDTDAILFAWHPGSMAGPALCDLLFGLVSPSGKLPVTFPKAVGQIPLYYNHKNTGRPPSPNTIVHIDDIEPGATQTSLGMTAFHLDTGYKPRFPFGFGLSYSTFEYSHLEISTSSLQVGEKLQISVQLTNTGPMAASETTQLYIRDLVGSVTRPVRELKRFAKTHLRPGETRTLTFELETRDLSFYRRDQSFGVEPGEFHLWVGGDSTCDLRAEFRLEAG